MKVIQAPNIARLHELAVKTVVRYGYPVVTEDNEHTIECEPVTLVCRTPFAEPRYSELSSLKQMMLDDYARCLIEGYDTEVKFEYDYHKRLYEYERYYKAYEHNSSTFCSIIPVNQIQYIIDKLKEQPTSRRAQAITWIVGDDNLRKDVPCLQYIQCHIVSGKLDMTAMFRSNDMLVAAGANMFALTNLMRVIADALGVEVGTYTHISLIPHVYDVRDADELMRFTK